MLDKDHLEDQMTIYNSALFNAPWHVSRLFRRVARLNRMVHEGCEGEDRNPIVDGHYTLTLPN
jgi:hypothetical protein